MDIIISRKKAMAILAKDMRVLPIEKKKACLAALSQVDTAEFNEQRLSQSIYKALYQTYYYTPKYPFAMTPDKMRDHLKDRKRFRIIFRGICGYKEATPAERNAFCATVRSNPGRIAAYKYAHFLKQNSFERT